MPATTQDVKLTVRDQLRAEIEDTEFPVALAPERIHVGWFNDALGFPEISVSNDEEGPIDGGATGYSAIAGDGSGGIQTPSGLVLVTCWGGSRDDYDACGAAQ